MKRPTAPHRINYHEPDGAGLEEWEPINPDDLISGTPVQRGYLCDEIEETGYIAGVWDCTAQVDHLAPYGVDEFMYLLDGTVIMGMPDGSEVTINAGEAFMIPKGLNCQWKQPGYVRKIFMILDEPHNKRDTTPAANPSLDRITVSSLSAPKVAEGDVSTTRTDFVNATGTMSVSVSDHAATKSAARAAPANEVICVIEGALSLEHEGQTHKFAKGESVYLPKGCVTGWQTEAGTRLLTSSYVG